MGRWLETYQTPEEILMAKIKSTSLGIITKLKSENPDFDIDFESFVKELTADETQLTRLFEILIRDSYKRSRRSTSTRSSPQVPPASSPAGNIGEARFARLIQQHQQQRLIAATRSVLENESRSGAENEGARNATFDGQRWRILSSRSSPGDFPTRMPTAEEYAWLSESPPRASGREPRTPPSPITVAVPLSAAREEDKEEEGIMDDRDNGLDTVGVS